MKLLILAAFLLFICCGPPPDKTFTLDGVVVDVTQTSWQSFWVEQAWTFVVRCQDGRMLTFSQSKRPPVLVGRRYKMKFCERHLLEVNEVPNG